MRAYLTVVLVALIVACALPPTTVETAAQRSTVDWILLQSDCEHRGGHKVKGKCFLPPSAAAASAAASAAGARKR